MKNLFIVKRITEDKSLSDNAFVVWCALRSIMQKNTNEYFVSYNLISDALYGRVPERKEQISIKKGYEELKSKELVKEVLAYTTKEFKVDLSALYFKKGNEYFSDLTDEEMQRIMNIKTSVSNCKLLRYFTCMVGTFNRSNDLDDCYKGKIGGMSLEHFRELIGISKATASDYNKILEENELLFVIRHKDFLQGTNSKGQSELREIPNTYSRWCDKELAKQFAEHTHGYVYFHQQKDIQVAKANHKRGMAQKYIAFCKGKQYDIETIKEMYCYCQDWNANQLVYHNEQVKLGYEHELQEKDMSVFDDYILELLDIIDTNECA